MAALSRHPRPRLHPEYRVRGDHHPDPLLRHPHLRRAGAQAAGHEAGRIAGAGHRQSGLPDLKALRPHRVGAHRLHQPGAAAVRRGPRRGGRGGQRGGDPAAGGKGRLQGGHRPTGDHVHPERL